MSAQPPHAPPPAPGRASPGGARLARALALGLLLGAVAVAGGVLLSPPGMDRLPGAEALGQPAPATLKADRDYEVVDPEATARRREAAAAAERPVYDHDDGADEEAAARIHAAFALMREEEAALRRQHGGAEAGELSRRYAAQRDAFVARLQLVVRDDDLLALAAARFAEPVERELAGLAAKGLDGPVVGELALLPDDREAGMVVRTFQGGQISGERPLKDLALVRDVATARDEVARTAAARLAAQPPALRVTLPRLAAAMVRPTLVHNLGETERRRAEAAARVRPVVVPVRRGERIVTAGQLLEPRHLAVLDAIRARVAGEDRTRVRLGGAALVALLVVALWRFAGGALPRFRPGLKDSALLAALLAGGLAMAGAGLDLADLLAERVPGLPREALTSLLPLAAGALVASQVLAAEAALLLAVATGLGAGLVAGPSLPLALHGTVTALVAAGLGARGRRGGRAGLWGAGLEMLLVRLARRPALVPLDDLVSRLGALERRLSGGGGAPAPQRERPPVDRPDTGSFQGARPREPRTAPKPRPAADDDRGEPPHAFPAFPEPGAAPAPRPPEPRRPVERRDAAPDYSGFAFPEPAAPQPAKPRPEGPPPAPEPPAPIPEGIETFRAIVDRVSESRPELGAFLGQAALLELSPTTLVIAYPKEDPFAREVEQHAATVRAAAEATLGGTVTLSVERDDVKARSVRTLARLEAEAEENRRRAAIAKARSHPRIADAIEVLGARLKDLKLADG